MGCWGIQKLVAFFHYLGSYITRHKKIIAFKGIFHLLAIEKMCILYIRRQHSESTTVKGNTWNMKLILIAYIKLFHLSAALVNIITINIIKYIPATNSSHKVDFGY